MTHLRDIIDPQAYRDFAGPDWPSLDDIVNHRVSSIPAIAAEVAEFVRAQQENYNFAVHRGDDLAQANQQRQQQEFYDKQYQGKLCTIPWTTLGINTNGDAYICESPSWVPLFVGNIVETTDIFDLLNSVTAQRIRQEILSRRYFYCNNRICRFFATVPQDQYQTQGSTDPEPDNFSAQTVVNSLPRTLILDFDYTCNLHCPSCRNEVVNYNRDHVRRAVNDQIVDKIKDLIVDRVTTPMTIRWCGGELFISAAYLELLDYITKQNKNIRHVIQTNGHYLKSRADLIQQLWPNIASFRISFDAATPETYQRVRRGGSWTQLLNNVTWLLEHRSSQPTKLQIQADYVVQLDNYKEIPAFVALCKELGIDSINWQKMWNWGTWPQLEFDEKNIYDSQHPKYNELCSIFKQINYPIL